MKTAIQLSGVVALGALAYLCLTLSVAVRLQQKHLAATEMQVGESLRGINKTLDKIDLDLDEFHRVTLEAGLTAMEARKASAKESAYLDQWNSQFANLMGEATKSVASIQPLTAQATDTIAQSGKTIAQLQAPIAQLNADLAALQPVIAHTDALVTDPNIPAVVANVRTMTVNGDDATKDLKDYIHGILHPSWPKRIWGYTVDVVHAAL